MYKQAFRELATELVMEALTEAKAKGYSYELLAQKIGGSPHSYRHYAYGEALPALAAFIGILLTTKSKKPLKRLCELVGLKAVEIEESSLPSTVSKAMKEAGEAFAEVTRSIEDGEVTEEERRACLKEINEAIDELIKLKNQLEEKS